MLYQQILWVNWRSTTCVGWLVVQQKCSKMTTCGPIYCHPASNKGNQMIPKYQFLKANSLATTSLKRYLLTKHIAIYFWQMLEYESRIDGTTSTLEKSIQVAKYALNNSWMSRKFLFDCCLETTKTPKTQKHTPMSSWPPVKPQNALQSSKQQHETKGSTINKNTQTKCLNHWKQVPNMIVHH